MRLLKYLLTWFWKNDMATLILFPSTSGKHLQLRNLPHPGEASSGRHRWTQRTGLLRNLTRNIRFLLKVAVYQVNAFAWEPTGNKFCCLHGESPRISATFYEIKGGKVELLGELHCAYCAESCGQWCNDPVVSVLFVRNFVCVKETAYHELVAWFDVIYVLLLICTVDYY